MTVKSTNYAKIDRRQEILTFWQYLVPATKFYCKYNKENIAHRSECPEIIGKTRF